MKRSDRLYDLIEILKDGKLHRAEDLARVLKVSLRTIYRDMETLAASGVPVEGERGLGYTARATLTLPPLNLTEEELEALHLGLATLAYSPDDDLKAAAKTLAEKIDAVLPEDRRGAPSGFGLAVYPFADAAQAFRHIATLRGAIRARQRLAVTLSNGDEMELRPLKMDYWGRVWTLVGWDERSDGFVSLRADHITEARMLAGLFMDEPGKRLEDFEQQKNTQTGHRA